MRPRVSLISAGVAERKLKSKLSEPSLAQCLSKHSDRPDIVKRDEERHHLSCGVVDLEAESKEMEAAKQVILVTGGSGFLGQHVVKLLQEKANDVEEIRVFDIKPYQNKLGHPETKPIRSIVGDIRKPSEVSEALRGVDAVIHTAGLVSFGTFPDYEGMKEINVHGTKNVLQACIERHVKRLVYTSTIDVVIGYDDIVGGDETLPIPRDHLFPGYPDTKYQAEKLVLEANGTPFSDDHGERFCTLVLRPNVMYGEGDPFFVTAALQSAMNSKGVLTRVGDGQAIFQSAYVGNMAWAHIKANSALQRDPTLGGHVFFITDDTPLINSLDFMETFLKLRGFSLSTYSVPYSFVYCLLFATESFLKFISPVYKFNMSTPLCSLVYINMNIHFKRDKAENLLDYKPLYKFSESVANSTPYYENWKPSSS